MTHVLLGAVRMLQRLLDLDAGAQGLPGVIRLHPPPLAVQGPLRRVEDLVHVELHPLQPVLHAVPLHAAGQVDAVELQPPQPSLAQLLAPGKDKERPGKMRPDVECATGNGLITSGGRSPCD